MQNSTAWLTVTIPSERREEKRQSLFIIIAILIVFTVYCISHDMNFITITITDDASMKLSL